MVTGSQMSLPNPQQITVMMMPAVWENAGNLIMFILISDTVPVCSLQEKGMRLLRPL